MSKIKDIATVGSGQSAPQDVSAFVQRNDGAPFIRAGSLDPLTKGQTEDSCEHLSDVAAKKHRMTLYPVDTILFAKSGMSAKLGRVYRLRKPAYVVSHLATVIPNSSVIYPSYLERWFKAHPPSQLIKDEAYPSIRTSEIDEIEIKLPPLAEQREIAAILDKADAIRQKRQQAIDLLNDLLRSTFLDMFGDPVSNSRGWDMKPMEDVAESITYGTSEKADVEPGGVPVLRMGNLTNDGQIDLSDLKYLKTAASDQEKFLLKENDLLFNRTNSRELVGKTAVWIGKTEMAYAGYLIRVRFKKDVSPYYVSAALNSARGKAMLFAMAKPAVNMSNISASDFKRIKLSIPPSSLQRKYEEFTKSVNKQRHVLQKSEAESETLFKALTQKTFKGTL